MCYQSVCLTQSEPKCQGDHYLNSWKLVLMDHLASQGVPGGKLQFSEWTFFLNSVMSFGSNKAFTFYCLGQPTNRNTLQMCSEQTCGRKEITFLDFQACLMSKAPHSCHIIIFTDVSMLFLKA